MTGNSAYPFKLQLTQQRRNGKTKRTAGHPDFETVMQCFDEEGREVTVADLDFDYPMNAHELLE